MPTLLHMCKHGYQVIIGVVYGMQAANPVNIATIKCNRKRKSRGKWIILYMVLISRAGRDNWIGEAIVAQAFHEAIRHIHRCGLLVSL